MATLSRGRRRRLSRGGACRPRELQISMTSAMTTQRHLHGFSVLEVMVALIIISVGLLGIAKMQALAIASTTTSRTRSIAALEAASLASAMRADRAYWS